MTTTRPPGSAPRPPSRSTRSGGQARPARSASGGLAARRPRTAPAPRRSPAWLRPAPTSTRLWVTQVLAALTLVAGLLSIDEVLVGSGWLLRPVLAVAWVLTVGATARRSGVPTLLVPLLQTLLLLVLLGLLFEAWTPEAVGELLRIAAAHIQVSGAPAGVVPAVELVLTAAIGLLAVVVDALAARWPALVALPVLAVVVTGSTFAPLALPWQALVLPAVLYVAMLASAGSGTSPGRAAGDRVVVLATAGVAVALGVVATGVATTLSTEGRLERTQVAGLGTASPFTGLVGDLLRGDERELLTFTSPYTPRYLRTVALTEWTDNEGWSLAEEPARDRTDGRSGPGTGNLVITSAGYEGRFLPVPERTLGVPSASQAWLVDESLTTWHRADAADPGRYEVLLDPSTPTADQLAGDTVSPRPEEVEVGDLTDEVREMAQEVTAAHEGPFAKALALQQWFTTPSNGFVYSLRVPEGTSGDLLLDFLQLRRGYCEQYASAMAVMLRSLDIPARVVIGFGSGSMDEAGVTTITSHNAHAWVEVRFDGAGWVRFDPTPGGGGQGDQAAPGIEGLPPGPAQPGQDTGVDGQGDPTAGEDQSDPSPSAPSASAQAPEPDDGATSRPITVSVPGVDETNPWVHVGRGEIALIVLLLVLTGPQAVRWWRARRRLAVVGAGGPRAAVAAWEEIEDLALDHGRGVPASATPRDAGDRVADDAHLPAGPRAGLVALVREAEGSWYDGGAPVPSGGSDGVSPAERAARREHGARLAATVHHVALGLEHHRPQGPWRWWLPPSLRRRRRH